jgi:hypothetical protein
MTQFNAVSVRSGHIGHVFQWNPKFLMKLNIFEVFLRKYILHSKMCVYTKTWASNEN